MKPPKTIYVHKYAAHIFMDKEDDPDLVEYSLKGEELRSIKRWLQRKITRDGKKIYTPIVLMELEEEIDRRLKKIVC